MSAAPLRPPSDALDRRGFLAGLAPLVAIPRVKLEAEPATRRLRRIGLQLYTVRREMAMDLPGTLARVAGLGYDEVEFAGYFGYSPAAVRSALCAAGLAAPSAHIGMPELENGWERAVDEARAVGHEYLIFAWVPDEHRTVEGYKRLAERFNRAGEMAARTGIRFGYHNYTYDFIRAGDGFLYDVLLAETDPRYVVMQMDVFWLVHAGADPFAYFSRPVITSPARIAALCARMNVMGDWRKPPRTYLSASARGSSSWQWKARAPGERRRRL